MIAEEIILIGGGGHCRSCIDILEQDDRYHIAGILDLPGKVGQSVLGYPIIGSDDDIAELSKRYRNFFITLGQIGSPAPRLKIYKALKSLKLELPIIIASDAYVSRYAAIQEGTIVMHQAVVNVNALIGKNTIINSKALIEHDAVIGDHCHISTAAIINGGVKVGSRTFFGSGAVARENAVIGENSFIKANSICK